LISSAKARRNQREVAADSSAGELPAGRSKPAEVRPAQAATSPDGISAMANLVQFNEGLYALDVGEFACPASPISDLEMPIVQVSTPPGGRDRCVEILGASGHGTAWLGQEGGTVVVRSPPGGGHLLVTTYSHPGQGVAAPTIEIRRLDRLRSNSASLRSVDLRSQPVEIQTEIVLHMERLGDRRFPGRGWVGNRGKKLRIEAFSIRPIDTLTARDIEFKALGPNQRQTPWVSDAKLCGTRGQGLPLTGFAIRLAPQAGAQFDVIYQGAFFESGIVGPNRNGEVCIPPIAEDPLEAISVRVIRRPAR
jgi:Clostridial hydrophobic W